MNHAVYKSWYLASNPPYERGASGKRVPTCVCIVSPIVLTAASSLSQLNLVCFFLLWVLLTYLANKNTSDGQFNASK